MKQISNRSVPKKPKEKKPKLRNRFGKIERKHPKFGTSKLEQRFAKEFLDKLGVDYQWQFEAKEIGRFYDFIINPKSYAPLLIEIDGSYYHNDPRVVSQDKIKPMHRKNMRVDEYKNQWAAIHGIPLIRIWEKDINEKPKEVMKMLKERLYIQDEKQKILENKKNKRHVNKL